MTVLLRVFIYTAQRAAEVSLCTTRVLALCETNNNMFMIALYLILGIRGVCSLYEVLLNKGFIRFNPLTLDLILMVNKAVSNVCKPIIQTNHRESHGVQ